MANKEFDIHGMFASLCARDELLKITKEAADKGDQEALDEIKKMTEHMMKAASAADRDHLKKAVTKRAALLLKTDISTRSMMDFFGIKITPSDKDGIKMAVQIRLEGASNEQMQKWVDGLNAMIYTN
jgi:predicted lipid-binding transport protein (Tim44 family)